MTSEPVVPETGAGPCAISVREGSALTKVKCEAGATILDTLRKYGKGISAPCNGQGTCGKCIVEVAGAGLVRSCSFKVTRDIEVTLPERTGKPQILHDRSVAHAPHDNDSGLRGAGGRVSYKGIDICRAPGDAPLLGVAIDIGTTTVVAYLADLRSYTVVDVVSFINPQTRFGHDVISRIQYAMKGPEALAELKKVLFEKLNAELEAACRRNRVAVDAIFKVTVVGNPTMLHIACGVDPSSIALAPYAPAFVDKKEIRGGAFGLLMNPQGIVIALPSVSGYVGADITAGIATTRMIYSGENSLFIDIGTNGEMAMSKGNELFCCATAAGPAFEGALIQCGVGGIEGAISGYADGTCVTIGNGTPVGICGSGLIDIVADLLRKGIIDMTGFMENDFLIEEARNSATGNDIVLTPQDVRQVQLAKAAIAAGIRVMMDESGSTFESIGTLYLGGAFGNFMNIESAAAIGLIPPELREKVAVTGNVAGRGALSSLMSVAFETRVEQAAAQARYIELSTHSGFMDRYVMSMGFEVEQIGEFQ